MKPDHALGTVDTLSVVQAHAAVRRAAAVAMPIATAVLAAVEAVPALIARTDIWLGAEAVHTPIKIALCSACHLVI
jgi:hypothetical protein